MTTLRWSYRSFAAGVISAVAGLSLLGFIQPPQSLEDLEAQGWQPSWKDDEGKWQSPWIGRWENVAVAVADINARSEMNPFMSSVTYWNSGYLSSTRWTHISPGNLTEPLNFDQPATILIEGDCLADITAPEESLIHILGNVSSSVRVGELSEIVIGGSVTSAGSVHTVPIVRTFVGGDFNGIARDGGSDWWIGGTMGGKLSTAGSSTNIQVNGDFLGTISAIEKNGLNLAVNGYMPAKELYSIAKMGYLEFHASVGISDENRGLYPKRTGDAIADSQYRSSRWVVHRAREINVEK